MKPGKKPTLLVLASTYPRWKDDPEPGFVHELAKRLVGCFRVIVLCPHAADALLREVLDDVEIVRYRYAPARWETLVNNGGIINNLRASRWKYALVPGFVLAQAWQAWRLTSKEGVGIIHAHWLVPQGMIAALLQSLPGRKAPFLVTSHGADLHALNSRFMDRLKGFVIGRASAITIVSKAMHVKLQALGANRAQISVMPMGVEMRRNFTVDASVQRSEREILFVGRLVEKKGLHYLLEAMPAVLRQVPDAFLSVVGFGPEEATLKAQVRALGVELSVHFLGALPHAELPAFYRRAAVFVAPFVRAQSGDEEGLGLVLVEAISCGCPIVAGDVPALVEVLGDDFGDMVIDPRDGQALAQKIVGLLAEPIATRGRAAQLRQTIGMRFDWDRVAKKYASLLRQVMRRP